MTELRDEFNRPDNASSAGTPDQGGPYIVQSGTWSILNNQLRVATGVASNYSMLVVDTGSPDTTVEFDIPVVSTDGFTGALIRTASTTSGFAVFASQMHNVNGGAAVGGAFTETFVSGDRMRVVALGTAITVYRSASGTGPWVEVMTTTSATYQTNTRFGVQIFGAATALASRFDNLLIYPSSPYMPDVMVEIAFNAGYYTATGSRTWTDVSSYVELGNGIDITHGRADEFANAEANRLTLTLDNSDGRFTAGKTGGAYYPNVKIGRPIRVTATPVGGAASVRFLGYVDEWPTSWQGTSNYAQAVVTASSRIARLGFDAELDSTISEEYVSTLGDPPLAYWPLQESAEATSAVDLMGGASMYFSGWGDKAEFGHAMNLPGDPSCTGIHHLETGSQNLIAVTSPPVSTTFPDTVSIEGFFAINRTGASGIELQSATGDGGGVLQLFADGPSGTFFAGFNDGTIDADLCSFVVDPQKPHHAAALLEISATGTADLSLIIDGVLTAFTSTLAMDSPDLSRMKVGGDGFEGQTVAHVAINGDPTRYPERAAAGLTGFDGESAGARIERYAGYAGIDLAEVDAEDGNPVGVVSTSGGGVIDAMRRVEGTEDGVLFDARDNSLTFHGREHRYHTTSAFTLSAATQQIEANVTPKLDRSTLANDVTATTTNDGSSARAINQTSIDEYGFARTTIEIAGNQDAGYQAAYRRVALYGEPLPRILALGVDMLPLSTALQGNVMDADLGTRITVAGLPTQAPATSIDFFVEGYTEQIGSESYEFSFNVSPHFADLDTFWILQDATFGIYDDFPLAY